MPIPQATDIAKVLPAALAEAGGSLTMTGLQEKLGQNSKFRIASMSSQRQIAYLHRTFQEAVDILIRSRSVERKGESIVLTDRGWGQAEAMGVGRPSGEPSGQPPPQVTIDVEHALPLVELRRRDGTWIRGHLRFDAPRYQGRPFEGHYSELLDDLYSAEVNGLKSSDGFYSALKEEGVVESARELLETKCRVRLVGLVPERRAARGDAIMHVGKGGRPGRRTGMTWERLVCEVIGEIGGHADLASICGRVERRAVAKEHTEWRAECMQALRNHTTPAGRGYFELAEVHGQRVYALTELGQRLAARRTEDTRAPTLSKLLAKAISADGDRKLTDYERYALFHLAVELGKPAEAQAIYHLLPEDFPDEDRYHMAQHLLTRAEELRDGRE